MASSAASAGFALALLFFFGSPSLACLWDRDTVAIEAEGKSDVVDTLTGRFPRFPSQYFEMRLERVSNQIRTNPDDLSLYDDACVSADRLGLGEEAIDWMHRKKVVLDRLGPTDDEEALYRYHANLGTVCFHEWLRRGATVDDLDLAITGRSHVIDALAINPDAHFGREEFQKIAMDWFIESVQKLERGNLVIGTVGEDELDDAIEGLAGLIRLGDAWRSPDITFSMNILLMKQMDNYLALLAFLRYEELLESGRGSLAGDLLSREDTGIFYPRDRIEGSTENIDKWFKAARVEADAWQAARWAFMEGKFAEGLHPDTTPNFWDSFDYKGSPPELPKSLRASGALWPVVAIVFVAVGALIFLISRRSDRVAG